MPYYGRVESQWGFCLPSLLDSPPIPIFRLQVEEYMKRIILSDTHFFHENIVEYCKRPWNYMDLIIYNWKSAVTHRDITIHLGDVHFGTKAQLTTILSKIPGRKFLVRGNHDHFTDSAFMDCGFDGVFDAITIGDALLTHEPTFICGGVHKWNVHGHLHNIGYDGVLAFGGSHIAFNDGKHILYSPELENYKPVEFTKLIARKS